MRLALALIAVLTTGCTRRALPGAFDAAGDAPASTDGIVPPDGPVPDLAPPCHTDLECAATSLCLETRCDLEAHRCIQRPRRMQDPKHVASVFPLGGYQHAGETWLLAADSDYQPWLQQLGLDGLVGAVTKVGPVSSDRAWDSAAAPTPSGPAVLTALDDGGGGIDLRLAAKPGQVAHLAPAGIFIALDWSGSGLLASTDYMDTCGLAWASPEGSWLSSAMEVTTAGCPRAWILGHGLPAQDRPAGFTAAGEAVFFSTEASGAVKKLVASPGKQNVQSLSLPKAGGPPYFHSLMTRLAGGRVGALWARVSDPDGDATQINLALLDGSLEPVASPASLDVKGEPYAMRMDIAYCEGRFIAAWNDAAGDAVWELDPSSGLPLAPPLRFGTTISGGAFRVLCLQGGAAVADVHGVTTLRCPGL
jgi:hypothetical protein